MDAAVPPAAAIGTGPDLWAACEERSVVRLTLDDGQVLTGDYTSRVGMHFLHRTGPTLPLIGEITGPYGPGDVLAVEVVRTRAQVLADGYARLHGERVPGPEPRTRDDHEQRLQASAAGAPTCKRTCSAARAGPMRRDARFPVLPGPTRAGPGLPASAPPATAAVSRTG